MNDCEYYWLTACLWKKMAVVERLENQEGLPIGYQTVKGERCHYSECPYRCYVGNNKQNQINNDED